MRHELEFVQPELRACIERRRRRHSACTGCLIVKTGLRCGIVGEVARGKLATCEIQGLDSKLICLGNQVKGSMQSRLISSRVVQLTSEDEPLRNRWRCGLNSIICLHRSGCCIERSQLFHGTAIFFAHGLGRELSSLLGLSCGKGDRWSPSCTLLVFRLSLQGRWSCLCTAIVLSSLECCWSCLFATLAHVGLECCRGSLLSSSIAFRSS
mmetsp:Transcript_39916/g.60291  ORF Transcript_39916/g.60291 Transcript_39916/m.60291 type:complete len:210 (-) Transcript_39916:512-1141(-)